MKRKFWHGIFKRTQEETEPEHQAGGDLLKIAKDIETIVDGVSSRIFAKYSEYLLVEDITFIVPAVWGAARDGDLIDIQKEIHREVAPFFQLAFQALDLRKIRPDQEFALGYILRSLIVSKIVYMIEASKRRQAESRESEGQNAGPLVDMDPVGRA